MIGNGIILTKHATSTITGNSGNIPTSDFVTLDKTSFPTLTFDTPENLFMTFDDNTGIFTFLEQGIIDISIVLNVQAAQASAEFQLIPEFNFGSGWVAGTPRRKVLTAIKADQITMHGNLEITKGSMLKWHVKAVSGDVIFCTETLAAGTPIETILPAAKFYYELDRMAAKLLT